MGLKTLLTRKFKAKPVYTTEAYTPIDFTAAQKRAHDFAALIEEKMDDLIKILLTYESHEVATDEIDRTLDLLKNIEENKSFFKLRIGAVAAFLPRNQPLYAFSCFVVVPSLMAQEVHFRIPHSMKDFLPQVLSLLNVFEQFPNIIVSNKERMEFLKERSALRVNPKTKESRPVTDAVIFTGTSAHADQLRAVFDRRTLFISNGSGHNPVVIGKDAKISSAVEAVLTLSLYNQGQDCAAPNSILVHSEIYKAFMEEFYKQFSTVKIGPYHDHTCRIGPISDPDDLPQIQTVLIENRYWLDAKTSGVIRSAQAIVEPTIICKPLTEGGNFTESFAPIIFIQEYTSDKDLSLYFEDKHYAPHAMYVTLYGTSPYIQSIIDTPINGKVLHRPDTFLHNTHLHAHGVERGIQPYGGYGIGASSLSINGKVTAKPTLPQRDIFECIAQPLLSTNTEEYKETLKEYTEIEYKNVEKILRLKRQKGEEGEAKTGTAYVDSQTLKDAGTRYVKIDENNIYHLSAEPHVEFIAALDVEDREHIKAVTALLKKKSTLTNEEFLAALYAIPKLPEVTEKENGARQLRFFQNIYQLLFKKNSGPRLGVFLWELPEEILVKFLDV